MNVKTTTNCKTESNFLIMFNTRHSAWWAAFGFVTDRMRGWEPLVWRKGGEAHSPSCLKSSVQFPQSVMIWGAMSSAGVGPLCFLKTNVTASVYQEILEHFMLPSAEQHFKDADFIFQQDLAPAHTAKSTKSWLNDHVLVCLTGQQTHQTWTP